MCKHAKMLIKATNLEFWFLCQFRRFQNRNLLYTFQTLFLRTRCLALSTFYIKMNQKECKNAFNIVFHIA